MVKIIKHPLVQHKLYLIRDKNTKTKQFRDLIYEISQLIAYEAMSNLKTELVKVNTPLATTEVPALVSSEIALIPILRAGLPMCDAVVNLIPAAKIGHIGIYRNPETHLPVKYFCRLPNDIAKRDIFLLDPMLATGGSVVAAIDLLKEHGAKNINLICIIAAPEGIAKVKEAHSNVNIYTASVDEKLDEDEYIIPGLGDAGDRMFGTM